MAPKKWNLLGIHDFCRHKEDLQQFLVESGLIRKSYKCPKCKSEMKCGDLTWRCQKTKIVNKRKEKCNVYISKLKHSWFSKSKLSIPLQLKLTYMILCNYKSADIRRELGIASHTVCDWKSFVRQALMEWAIYNSEKIGGNGKIVEIDESKFGKRKYHRGHFVEGQWVMGGVDRETGKIFMVPVEKRDAATLIPIIKEWICQGSTVYSDKWKAYGRLGKEGYNHLSVNHSLHFVDPETGTHTNTIESTWRHAKQFMPNYNRRKSFYPGYLSHYMFLKHCKSNKIDPMVKFIEVVKEIDFDSSV